MPLHPRQDQMLSLAGTVRLPSPPPATASVSVLASSSEKFDKSAVALSITHRISDRLFMTRAVRLSDVRAIRAAWPKIREDQSSGGEATPVEAGSNGEAPQQETRTLGQFRDDALQRAERGEEGTWLERATVFVVESAPVALTVEAALTAAESVEYYPPIAGDGSGPSLGARSVQEKMLAMFADEDPGCLHQTPPPTC